MHGFIHILRAGLIKIRKSDEIEKEESIDSCKRLRESTGHTEKHKVKGQVVMYRAMGKYGSKYNLPALIKV